MHVSLRVEGYRKRKNATHEGRSALLARNRTDNKMLSERKKDKILRLNKDIEAYEDKLRNNGINVPSSPDISGSTNWHDQKFSATKSRKIYKPLKPPPDELKSMSKEAFFKWRKEKRSERDRARKRVERSQQKQLICNLEERVSMLKTLYDQNQKPAMPDDSQDKISDPSRENRKNDMTKSINKISDDDWEDTLIAKAPSMETILADVREVKLWFEE
ncbi:hypothetical protein ACHAWF_013257 [Thalassiosira exigua]